MNAQQSSYLPSIHHVMSHVTVTAFNINKKFNVFFQDNEKTLCKNHYDFHINMLTVDLLFQIFLLNQNSNSLQNKKEFLHQFMFLKINNSAQYYRKNYRDNYC